MERKYSWFMLLKDAVGKVFNLVGKVFNLKTLGNISKIVTHVYLWLTTFSWIMLHVVLWVVLIRMIQSCSQL